VADIGLEFQRLIRTRNSDRQKWYYF